VPAGFSWGNWFPCQNDYRTTDCIDSVKWIKSDGSIVTGAWTPSPTFDFNSYKQTWAKDGNGQSAQYFEQYIGQAGTYSFDGLGTPCGNNQIVIDARGELGGFQVNAQPTCQFFYSSKFEERFEVTLRSRYLKGIAGTISSNGKNPEIAYAEAGKDQLLTIRANFAYIAWNDIQVNGQYVDVCQKNEYHAKSGGWGLWNEIRWVNMIGDTWFADHPGDLITGTNGWNCGGSMYWDPSASGLVMQVGSPHYDPSGKIVEGWFEGAIRGRYVTAKFGIKPQQASGQAKLEIVYNDGQTKTATIAATYDPVGDWIYLKGYGFTYSSPKLIVTFGKNSSTPSSSVTQTKSTITCIKGKVTKKITASKPVCPAGFKKG